MHMDQWNADGPHDDQIEPRQFTLLDGDNTERTSVDQVGNVAAEPFGLMFDLINELTVVVTDDSKLEKFGWR